MLVRIRKVRSEPGGGQSQQYACSSFSFLHLPIFQVYRRAIVELKLGVIQNSLPVPDAPLISYA